MVVLMSIAYFFSQMGLTVAATMIAAPVFAFGWLPSDFSEWAGDDRG